VYPDAFAGVPSERTADGERASAATSAARSPTDACRAADASKNTSFKDCVQGDPARQHAHPADMRARDVMRLNARRARAFFCAHARARRSMTNAAFDDALDAVRRAKNMKQTTEACEAFAARGRVTCEEAGKLLREMPFQTRRIEALHALAPALVDFDTKHDDLGVGLRSWEGSELVEVARGIRQASTLGRQQSRAPARQQPATMDAPKLMEAFKHTAVQIQPPHAHGKENSTMTDEEVVAHLQNLRAEMARTVRTVSVPNLLFEINMGLVDVQSANMDPKTGALGRIKFAPGGPIPPPELAKRGVTKREWSECIDLLWSSLEKNPFYANPAMECIVCCCPFGPVTFAFNHVNPICWCLYCPFIISKGQAVKKMNENILSSRGVVAVVLASGNVKFFAQARNVV
jgi:hypothetical protein